MLFEINSWGHPIFYIATLLLGCCVGSYLNAVIYRLPLGLSTRDPKRSFCPICKEPIPFYRNIPLVTWLIQRGKCAECAAPIPVRYFLVELLTGLVWVACWWFFAVYQPENYGADSVAHLAPVWYPAALAGFFIVISTICIVITFIDIEHMIIPQQLTIGGALVALVASAMIPWFWGETVWYEGLKVSVIGGCMGFAALWLVVLLGKLAFGKRKIELEKAMDWHIADAKEDGENPNDNVSLVLENEDNYWHELFYRKSDRVLMKEVSDLVINGEPSELTELSITQSHFYLGEKTIKLEDLKSLSGKVKSLVIPREAMGMGDVHLLGMIGLCLGAKSLLLVVLGACGVGILIHIAVRAGLGKQVPFGPSLILGAVLWVICGPQLVDWYMGWFSEMVRGG